MFFPPTAATILPACAGAVLFALAAAACAETAAPAWTPTWTVSGFGTVGAVHSDEAQADFTASTMKGDGAGRTASWSRHVDSKLGAQVDLALDPRWSAVLQVVTEQRADYSYQPRVEWANIKYQVTPELALRLGRIALPMFIAADYRKVGYAYPWVRTPVEVYGVLPLTNSDGADLSWHWNGEALRSTTQVFYGRTDVPLYDGARLHGHGVAGLSHTVEQGAFSARASVITNRLSVSLFGELFDALGDFGPQGRDIVRRLRIDGKRASALSIGLNYDPGQWFVMGEAGRSKVDGYLGGTRSAYLSGGWRHGNLTPYATWARVRGRPPEGASALSLAGLSAPDAAAGAALNTALATMLRAVPSQSTIGAGLRWDLASNLALKLQHERVTTRRGSRGMFINMVPDYQSGHTAQVTSASLDFVF
jgi:opacity protein-like surface antigen